MNLLKKVGGFFAAAMMVVSLTAAFPSTKVTEPAAVAVEAPAKGGITYKQLKATAQEMKGSKLTMKEKIALKVFGKKIASKSNPAAEGKSQVIALILAIVVGGLGVHRFYLGYTWQGVVQLLTAGGCGIWWLIDLIRIITGDLKPKDGEYGQTL